MGGKIRWERREKRGENRLSRETKEEMQNERREEKQSVIMLGKIHMTTKTKKTKE